MVYFLSGYPSFGTGDLKFKDENKDGKITDGAWTLEDHGDYKIIGNSRARYTFGLSANAQWNGFDLSLFAQGVGKKDYYPVRVTSISGVSMHSLGPISPKVICMTIGRRKIRMRTSPV